VRAAASRGGRSDADCQEHHGHETDSIFSRYAIVDAALMLAAQEKVAAKFPRQAKG
jgi:hypothetical protein